MDESTAFIHKNHPKSWLIYSANVQVIAYLEPHMQKQSMAHTGSLPKFLENHGQSYVVSLEGREFPALNEHSLKYWHTHMVEQ